MSKAGILASVRLNPRNTLVLISLAEKLGIDTSRASWSSIVHAVLASSLSTWVELGMVPEPDTFRYAEIAGRFEGGKNTRERVARNKALWSMAEKGYKEPAFLRNSIAAPLRPAQTITPTSGELAHQQAEEARLADVKGVVRDGVWMGERGGLMRPEDALPEGLSSAGLDQYPEDQTEAHEVPSDDALAVRYLALHQRREAGGLTEGEQAEYLRLNHLLFDGK